MRGESFGHADGIYPVEAKQSRRWKQGVLKIRSTCVSGSSRSSPLLHADRFSELDRPRCDRVDIVVLGCGEPRSISSHQANSYDAACWTPALSYSASGPVMSYSQKT